MKPAGLHNELDLIRLVAQGNEQAFRKVFDYYRKKLYNYAFRITDKEGLSEEIVMDAFLKIWINRAGLSGIHRFDSYLYTLVRNQAFNAIKRIAHEAAIIKELGLSNTEYQDCTKETIIYNDSKRVLDQAVDRLSPQQKLVYSLCHTEGLKYEEVASRLNISRFTVKTHMQQVLRSIRVYFISRTDVLMLIFLFLFR